MIAGVPPKDRTYKTMHNHLNSKDPAIRCPFVDATRIRRPELLLNVCDDKKKHHKITSVAEDDAEEILKQFIDCNFSYDEEEINVIVEWNIVEFKRHWD